MKAEKTRIACSRHVGFLKVMTQAELKRIEETKRLGFNRKFGKRYGVKLMELQGHRNPQGEGFVDIDFLFDSRMTAEAIGMMCESIAAWVGGELRGTVNIDFSGRPTLAIVVEFPVE